MAKSKNRSKIFLLILLSFSVLVLCSAVWYIKIFGRTGFDSVVFTLIAGTEGSNPVFFKLYFLYAFLPAALISAVLVISAVLIKTKQRLIKAVSLILSIVMLISACTYAGLSGFIIDRLSYSEIYETEFVKTDTKNITFPETKKNLIHIFLESMETTFASLKQGGALETGDIDELYEQALKNINFSDNPGFGGGYAMPGCTWTTAALTAYTSGAQMKMGINNSVDFSAPLENTLTINDILKENGYSQSVMVGSPMEYGLRQKLFETHGVHEFYDYDTALKDGIIEKGYKVNWGFEDSKLFEYAKEVLLKKSKENAPFAFYMLTSDTHHRDGYLCSECENDGKEKYDTVLKCSSRQVNKFIEWIKEQDFYKDTVIVITGDHNSMANEYIERNVDKAYSRRVYNCIINSDKQKTNIKNRTFTTLDMYPTVLSALGCEIKGARLGLGTDLFSGEKTLAEKYGIKKLSIELSKNSRYYKKL